MIPDKFKGQALPKHIQIAYSYLGLKEIVGKVHNNTILSWAKGLGLEKIYTNDEMAWCGLFFAHVMKEAGRQVVLNTKDSYDYLRALKYQQMEGVKKVTDAMVGDILIFQRPEGGHIGFCTGANLEQYLVLGGNQGNAVSEVLINKSRCVAILRPNYISYQPFAVVVANGKGSTNEA